MRTAMVSNTFQLCPKFIKKLHRRLVEVEKTSFGTLPKNKRGKIVPSEQHLAEIISTAFWASLQFEEGRTLRFLVTYASPCPFDHLGLVFDFHGKSLRVEELIKLAPAVVPPDGQIGVNTFLDTGLLYIWGLQTTSMTNVTFEALEPGRLVISFPMKSKIVEITGQKFGFINPEWNSQGLNLLSVRGEKNTDSSTEQMLSMLTGTVTQEILSRIRLLRHGGTIIFIGGDEWKKFVEKPITYDCWRRLRSVPRVTEPFEQTLVDARKQAAPQEDIKEKTVMAGINLLNDYQYRAVVADAARTIAYLTAVDGATVLNKDFEVLAFGAKIKESQKGAKKETVFKVSPYEEPARTILSQAFRGKRHLSAARFVINNPDSTAFVVSQDGGVSGLFVDAKNQLVAYRGLELLL